MATQRKMILTTTYILCWLKIKKKTVKQEYSEEYLCTHAYLISIQSKSINHIHKHTFQICYYLLCLQHY